MIGPFVTGSTFGRSLENLTGRFLRGNCFGKSVKIGFVELFYNFVKRFMAFLDYKHDQRLASNARMEVMMMSIETWVNLL